MNEFELFGKKREMEHVALEDAKSVFERGLKYCVGENYQWLSGYDDVVDWLSDNGNKGLLLFGESGLGKTLICAKIMPVIFQYYLKRPCAYVDAISLNACHRNPIDYSEIVNYAKPLIIDDFGIESIANEYGEKRDLFSEIVDKSEKNSRLLILSTNLTPEEIGERYGLRTLDRLRAIVRAVKIEGESLRNF